MHRVRVKICGVKRLEDARAVQAAGAHAIGLNFAPESPRCIGTPADAERFVREANLSLKWAGVFVNATPDFILDAVRRCGLTIAQLHGDEGPAFSEALRPQLPAGVEIWKAFRVSSAEDLAPIPSYPCDAVLLDAKVTGVRGGSGHAFDWSILKALPRTRPLVLAGGMKPENVAEAVRVVLPDWIDTASGVESAPGEKDPARIVALVQALLI